MSRQIDDEKLKEIVKKIVDIYHPERIYLFGSMARDEADENSDYDLMVIVHDDVAPEFLNSKFAYQALWGTKVATDIVIWKKSEFDKRLHLKASFPSTILREGKLLHAA